MPNYNFDDFLKALVDGISMYDGIMCGVPYDIPIFIQMYREDVFEELGLKPATTMEEFLTNAQKIQEAEGPRDLRHHRPDEVGPLLARVRLDGVAVGPWRLGVRPGRQVHRQRRGRPRRDGVLGEAQGEHAGRRDLLDVGRPGPVRRAGHRGHRALVGRVLPVLGCARIVQRLRPDERHGAARGDLAAHGRGDRLRRDPGRRPPGRLLARGVEVRQEPGCGMALRPVGDGAGDAGAHHHPRRRHRPRRAPRSTTTRASSRTPSAASPAPRVTFPPCARPSPTTWAPSRTCRNGPRSPTTPSRWSSAASGPREYDNAKDTMDFIKQQVDGIING